MNKKFLSAILFGALMVSSTGTFVSCKDYDDDIKDLQEQINSNKDAIAALQKLVGEGKWVTNISSIENGFSVTMSDGTTTSITGIKGADGKNGTEWTIGEDGFWYKDGEKTASQAVAKDGEDGKAGATAPSPKISADGFWVVYEWDADKGEFVEKTTEISAQGTGAYVVKKDGVYVLHIADETGAFQDVTLPATSDSFVAEAPYSDVRVIFETARWSKWSATNALAKELLKEFPALADIKTNDVVKQGGNLPLIVTPANVELTDKFAFALQGADGKTADIAVSTPVKGLPVNTSIQTEYMPVGFDYDGNGDIEKDEIQWIQVGKYMQTRATENDCFWALKVEPAYDTAKKKYAQVADASLSIANEKGATVKTAFAYTVKADDKTNTDVTIKVNESAKYAETIDVFEKPSATEDAIFTLENQYDGRFILSLTNEVEKEKYGLSVEGSKLHIANMPANETSIKVHMKLIALGLNGSVAGSGKKTENYVVEITINQGVETTGILADKAVTLAAKATDAKLRWNIKDLGLTAVQLDNFLKGDVKMTATREAMEEGQNGVLEEKKYVAYNAAVNFYDAKGDKITATYGGNPANYVTFGFDVDATATPTTELKGYTAEKFLPKDYVLTLTSSAKGTTTVIYSASATLAVSNPSAVAIKLNTNYVEDKVLQITGGKTITTSGDFVTYLLTEGVIIDNSYIKNGTVTFIDLDNANYEEEIPVETDRDKTNFAYPNWIKTSPTLKANKWQDDTDTHKVTAAEQQMYKVRNIRAKYCLFGNDKNTENFDFQAIVKSEVYSSDATKAVTMDATKLEAEFGENAKDNSAHEIDVTAALKSAVFVAGSDRGKSYDLFAKAGGEVKTTYYDYATIKNTLVDETNKVTYVVTDKSLKIEIALEDMKAFGFSDAAILKAQDDKDAKYYLISKNTASEGDDYKGVKTMGELWNVAKNYAKNVTATVDKVTTSYYLRDTDKEKALNADTKAKIALFYSYASKVGYATYVVKTTGQATPANAKITSVAIKFANDKVAATAGNYIANANDFKTGNNVNEDYKTVIKAVKTLSEDIPAGYVNVEMKLVIVDAWKKTMEVPFTIKLNTVKE